MEKKDILEELTTKLDLRILVNPKFETELVKALDTFEAAGLIPEIEVVNLKFLRLKAQGKLSHSKPETDKALRRLTIDFTLGNALLKDPLSISVEDITVIDALELSSFVPQKTGTIISTFYSQRLFDLYGIEMSYSTYYDVDRIADRKYNEVLSSSTIEHNYKPKFCHGAQTIFPLRKVFGTATTISREYDNLGAVTISTTSELASTKAGDLKKEVFSADMNSLDILSTTGKPFALFQNGEWIPNSENSLTEGLTIDRIYHMLKNQFAESLKKTIESNHEYQYREAFLRVMENNDYPRIGEQR